MDGGVLERKKIPVQKLWSGVIFSRDCGNCKSKSQQHHKANNGHGLPLVHSFKAILYDCSFGTVQASIALVMFTSHGLLLKMLHCNNITWSDLLIVWSWMMNLA